MAKPLNYTVLFLLCFLFFSGSASAYTLILDSAAPDVSGTFYTLKADSASPLDISTSVTCLLITLREPPPETLSFVFTLQKNGELVKATKTVTITPVWRTDPLNNLIRTARIPYTFPMPATGPASTQLSTGQYTFKAKLDDGTFGGQVNTSNLFTYTVYSGTLFFNDISTALSVVSPGAPCMVGDVSLQTGSAADWDAGSTIVPLDVSGLCADKLASKDGFSDDLHVTTGIAGPITQVTGTSGGIDWLLAQVTLDSSGGSYLAAAIALPDGITGHTFQNNQVWPGGFSAISPLPASTFGEDIVLNWSGDLYFHAYGLPFYVLGHGINLSLAPANSTGIELLTPSTYYVHQDQFISLPDNDFRRDYGFPSNDAMFREANSFGSNSASISGSGMNAHLEFNANASNIAFPKSSLTHPAFSIDIENNTIKPDSFLTGNNPVTLALIFSAGCPDANCIEQSADKSFILESDSASFFTNGALAAGFSNLGDQADMTSSELAWGGYNGTSSTFFRNDRDKNGVWLIPGFIMPQTAATPGNESATRIGQILLGSFSFQSATPLIPETIHPLNVGADRLAAQGDGFFAGINMGPEILVGPAPATPVPESGAGSLLNNTLQVRFNGNSNATVMDDEIATKYVMRRGGLTGVFNTLYGQDGQGDVAIYDYPVNFSRFSFSQALNNISTNTYIDGELTLPAPVGDIDGMRVGFSNLALTCSGNLGNGTLDTEPEPDWPNGIAATGCDGVDSPDDPDDRIDESCHVLSYWNMPVLVTGMTFTDNGAGECSGTPRVLNLNTRNVVERLGTVLNMSADFQANGTLANQHLSGQVTTWFDRPAVDQSQPGFSVRLDQAYLNEVADPQNLPSWQGFTVFTGRIDVPLFNDASFFGHLPNGQPPLIFDHGLDRDRDGITTDFDDSDSDSLTGDVEAFRTLLEAGSGEAAPKPIFSYSWPRPGIIDLEYRAVYQPSSDSTIPQFTGIPHVGTEIAGIFNIDSSADYITPKQTKFSFGVTANTGALADFSIDAGDLTSGVTGFLADNLNIDLSFVDSLLLDLAQTEQRMHDITGGDITDLLAEAIDQALADPPIATPITVAVNGLNQAHQAPLMLDTILSGPFETIRDELLSLITDPDLDFSSLVPDVNVQAQMEETLAPFILYNPDQLRPLYETYTGISNPEHFDELIRRYDRLQNAADDLISQLDQARTYKQQAVDFLTGNAANLNMAISDLITYADQASTSVHDLYISVTAGLGPYTTATDSNQLLQQLELAKGHVEDVRQAVAAIQLGDIADVLYLASIVAGSPLDVSMLHAAEDTANTAIAQLDLVIADAETNLTSLLNQLPLSDILATIDQFIGDAGLIQNSLRGTAYPGSATGGLIGAMESMETLVPDMLASLERDLTRLEDALYAVIPSTDQAPPTTWETAVTLAGQKLDNGVKSMILQESATTSRLMEELGKISDKTGEALSFATVFADPAGLELVITAPLANLLNNANFTVLNNAVTEEVVGILPNPSEEDIRAIIRGAILNRPEVEEMNRIFYEQFGFVSDTMDDVVTMLTQKINSMIRETIAALEQGLQEQLDLVASTIGPANWGVESAGIDGYALVSQDEIERIHLEADFTFAGNPDPTSYNAALDIATWNSSNEKSGCEPDGGTGNIDIVLSTHDVSAAMLGMDVGLREALLGFSLQGATPIGAFGRVYLLGEVGFETMTLYDLGFETAFGSAELYFAARGAARFSDYQVPMAAFYLGKSCPGNDVLARIDEEASQFLDTTVPLNGVYARGSVEVPVWNNGCALTVGVGADIGAWYFTEPFPGTYGGLLGGSAYGELGCLASLKGSLTLLGQKTGTDYSFAGSGWAAAGVGYCSASKWKSVRDARKDDWCLTGEATFGVTYITDWTVDGPDVSCCH